MELLENRDSLSPIQEIRTNDPTWWVDLYLGRQRSPAEEIRERIKQFEEEIMSEPDRYIMFRFNDSAAQRLLLGIGRDALNPVLEHLQANPGSLEGDLGKAWLLLLNWIRINIDPSDRESRNISDLGKWKQWVETVLSK
jgi:hypothetical protein